MKTSKIVLVNFLAFFGLSTSFVSAQTRSEREARIQKLLDSMNFTFVVESANPMSGGNIRLNTPYQISFFKDSLESFLPYFGTAFSAQFGASQSPLTSSGDFNYQTRTSKSGVQTVTIKINTPDVLTLSISPSGHVTLQVKCINRQPISFYGVITPNQHPRINYH